ncbi:MAG: DUF1294 domain-containing protein [Planctomycetales bacterium]
MLLGAAATAAIFSGLAWWAEIPWIAAGFAAINLVACAFYGCDKFLESRGWTRPPESALRLFAALGGTPGAYLGRRLFRDRESQRSDVVFWTVAGAQLVTLGWVIGWIW